VPFQVDPMLIPMFGRGNLSKKFAAGGGVKSGAGTPTSSPDKLDEFNRKLQRELEEENRRFEESGGSEFYSAIRQPMQDINEKLNQTLEMYRMGRASEADVQKLLPFFSEYDIASQFGRTDTGGYRPSDINAPSTNRLREFIEIQKPTIDANRPDMFPYDPLGLKSQERILQMGRGGPIKSSLAGIEKAQKAVKEAAKKTRKYPIKLPDPKPLSREDIRSMAQRMSQQVTGEFVRPDPTKSVNPAGKSRKQFEREQALSKNIRSAIAEPTVPVVDIEKQLDKLLVGLPGDPSIGGILRPGSFDEAPKGTRELVGIGDVELDVPAQLFGGSRYGAESVFDPEQDPAFWASNLGSARAIQNQITELSQAMDDRPVLSMFTKMTPEASNFALHTLDALLGYQQPHRLPKTKRQQLERAIRKGTPKQGKFPGFPGFENPEDVLLAAKSDTELRKHLINTLWKPTVTEPLKLRPGLDVLSAISHPEIENLPPGTSGFSMGRMRPGAELTESHHPTYSHDIPGEFIGTSKYPLPLELAFPRTTSFVRENIPTGEVFNTSKGVGLRDVIDPQYVDQIKLYEEFMKRYTGKKKGGAVRKGALAAVLS
jgi:hypothetical protein